MSELDELLEGLENWAFGYTRVHDCAENPEDIAAYFSGLTAKRDRVKEHIASLIAAERERCAGVARKHASGGALHTTVHGCAFAIEDEIRRGG